MNQSGDGVEEMLGRFLNQHGGRIEHILDRTAPEESIDPKQMLSVELVEIIRTVAKIDGGITRSDVLLAVKVLDCLWAGLVPEELRRRGKDFELQYFVSRLPKMPRDEFFCTLKCLRQFDIHYGSHDAEQYAELMRGFILREVAGIHNSRPSKHVITELVTEIDQIIGQAWKSDTSGSCEECERCYALLGLNPEPTHEEVRKKRRAFAEVLHPDQLAGKTQNARLAAEEQLKKVNAACDHILRCRVDGDANSCVSSVREDAGQPEFVAEYEPEPAAAPSPTASPEQRQSIGNEESGGVVWRYLKVSLRTVWRVTKVAGVLVLALIVAAIMLIGLITYLKEYWDGESRQSREEGHGGFEAEKLFGFLNGVMWLPRHIWQGLILVLSILTIAVCFTGQWLVELASEYWAATLALAFLCATSVIIWALVKERQAEFNAISETDKPTTTSWVMGTVVLAVLVFSFAWWNPSVSPSEWIDRHSNRSGSTATAHSPFNDASPSQASAFAQSATEQSSDTIESLPDQVLWDIKHPEALHTIAPVGDFQVADAMQFLFGNYDPEGRSSKWTGIKSHVEDSQADSGTASPYFDAEYNENGVLKHILLTATIPDVYFYGCHACSPITSIFVFANHDGKWIAETEEQVGGLGSWGKRPAVKLQRIGVEKYGVVFSTDDLAQGQYAAEDIVLVSRSASSVALLKIITEANNKGACGGGVACYSEHRTYEFVQSHDANVFDVIVTESGTKWQGGEVVPADNITRYKYRNGKYIADQSLTEGVPDDQSQRPIVADRATADCSAGKLNGLTIYAGPQSSFPVVGRVACGEVVTVLSPADDSDWFRIRTSSNVVGFVWMFLKASGS